jgi:glycosyltransferase involved in cell wall biosynthesis
LLRELNLGSAVEVSTCFLGSEEVLQELADSDLVVLPYAYSTESSSAAVRLPLASLTPVLCSDLSIFAELDGIAHKVAARDICSLSAALVRLSTNPTELMRYSKAQADFVEQFSWQNIARRFQELHRNTLTVAAEPNVASAVVGLG